MNSEFGCLRPMREKVIVRREPPVRFTRGGLALPPSSQKKSQIATVEALPTDYEGPLHVGDKVVLQWFAGTQLEWGENLFTVREGDVLALADDESSTINHE